MHVELLGQLGQRPLALHGGEGHLRLEGRGVVPARSSRHRLSLPAVILAAVRQKLHSARLSRFPEPALAARDPAGPGVEAERATRARTGKRTKRVATPEAEVLPPAAPARQYVDIDPWAMLLEQLMETPEEKPTKRPGTKGK